MKTEKNKGNGLEKPTDFFDTNSEKLKQKGRGLILKRFENDTSVMTSKS